MSKTIINDTNLEITDFKINKQNELEELQINGNEVSLGEESALEDNKESTISSNGTFEIEPSTGYDGMKKVTVEVGVETGHLYRWKFGTDANYRYIQTPPEDITVGSMVYVFLANEYNGMIGLSSQGGSTVDAISESGGVYTMTLRGWASDFVYTPGDASILPSVLTI